MTEQDIADALDVCANDSPITSTGPRGLTPRSRKVAEMSTTPTSRRDT